MNGDWLWAAGDEPPLSLCSAGILDYKENSREDFWHHVWHHGAKFHLVPPSLHNTALV
jgi:hypothetical protein